MQATSKSLAPRRAARALVVGDDPAMGAILVYKLEQAGLEVVAAEDGIRAELEIAWAVQHGRGLDLVVLNRRRTDCDGLDLLKDLRAAEWQVPTVLIAPFGESELRQRAIALGVLAVFDAPFDVDELIRVVERATGCAGEGKRGP